MLSRSLPLVALLPLLLAGPAGVRGDQVPAQTEARATLRPVERPEEDLLIFEVVLDQQVLSRDLLAYPHPHGVLVPLGQLLSLLELPIAVDAHAGSAQGWFGSRDRRFSLDLAQGEIAVAGRVQPVDSSRVELHADDIYVDAKLLSSWLPLGLVIDPAALRIRIVPGEKLPLQLQQERDARRRELAGAVAASVSGEGAIPSLPSRPFRLAGWPILDAGVRLTLRSDSEEGDGFSGRQSLLAEGDLLGMTAELLLSAGQGEEGRGSADRSRLTLGRRDPDGRLLGPLRATDARIGDLTPAFDPWLSQGRPGLGFEIARARSAGTLYGLGDFDRTVLTGNALPGWDVELYRNGALFAFQTVGEDGRYEFRDVPLQVGDNILRLVFYGPQGETREKVERIPIAAELPPPGETSYRLSFFEVDEGLLRSSVPEDETVPRGEPWIGAEVEYGLSRWLALEGGFSSLALADGRHDYTRFGLRTSLLGAVARLGLVRDARGGQLVQLGLRRNLGRRFSLALEHTELDGFRSDTADTLAGDLLSRTKARLDGQVKLPGAAWAQVPFSVEVLEDQRTAGRLLQLRGASGLAVPAGPLILGSRWRVGMTEDSYTADGDLLLNGRIRGLQMRGALTYGILPEPGLSSLDVVGDLRRQSGLGFRFSVSQSLRQSGTSVTAGVDRPLTSLVLGLDAGFSSRSGLRLSGSLSFSLARDPRAGSWRMRRAAGASQGAVSARAFLDLDANGRFDSGDRPLPGVGFTMDGRNHEEVTKADGTAWLPLPPYRPIRLTLDERTLEDVSWAAERDPIVLLARPGMTWTEDIPVVATADLDGTVSFREGQGARPASNVRLQLLDGTGEVVEEARSQFDGFYLFEKVRPGRYVLRIDPEQAARLGLRPAEREVILGSGGSQSGVEILLER